MQRFRLSRLGGSLPGWWVWVLGLSALLAVSFGLRSGVDVIPLLGPLTLLRELARDSAGFFAGLLPALTIVAAAGRHMPGNPALRWWLLAGSVPAAVAAGLACELAASLLLSPDTSSDLVSHWPDWLPESILRYAALTALVAALREVQRRSAAASEALHQSRVRDAALQGQMAEVRLQMLQAQIEPHFLFNSLANVRRLSRLDPTAGATMLRDLPHYLKATLPRLRSDASTLAREAELARAFLAVHKIRMGGRLEVEFHVPPELAEATVPPMMLLTLIENSLKHGLGPLPQGGRIRIEAARQSGGIVLEVSDTGAGLVAGHGKGTGLANIRARLKSAYGPSARLTLRVNEPQGVIASILLPDNAP